MKYLTCTFFLFGSLSAYGYLPNPAPKPKHDFMVIAHRGDHVTHPENTLAAYQQAITDGADYVEIDIRTTKDGRLISLHDVTVNRMTDGKGLVKDMTLYEIEKLHIHSKDSKPDLLYTIPTFEQILKLCKNKIYLYIDFKEADPVLVYRVLKRYKMEKQVLIYINKAEQFTGWRRVAPKMPLMVSLPDSVKNEISMKQFIDQNHPDILDGDYRQYNQKMLALAISYGIPVWPDGQSSAEGHEVWDEALAKGLKGLQSDHPEGLVKYLLLKGLR